MTIKLIRPILHGMTEEERDKAEKLHHDLLNPEFVEDCETRFGHLVGSELTDTTRRAVLLMLANQVQHMQKEETPDAD